MLFRQKNKFISVFVLVCVLLSILPGYAVFGQIQGNVYYVSLDRGSIYGTGNIDDPFITIQRAANEMQPGDTCIIEGGTYKEQVTVPISGTSEAPITFKAMDGHKVIIDGTEDIGGFELVGDNIYCTQEMKFSLLEDDGIFADGNFLNYAKFPSDNATNYSFDNIKWFYAEDGSSVNTIVCEELNQPDNYWNGAYVKIVPGPGWYMYKAKILSSSNGQLIVEDLPYEVTKGNKFYIYKSLNALDDDNEWFYDNSTRKLYVKLPQGQTPENTRISARIRNYGFNVNNKSYINIENIDFDSTGINVNDSDCCIFDNLNISDFSKPIELSGIGNVLKNSHIERAFGDISIDVKGTDNIIFNNLIEYGNGGTLVDMGGQRNKLSYNTIRYSVRQTVLVAESKENIIEHNEISHCALYTNDVGTIYGGFGDGANTQIRYNVLHDGLGTGIGDGIYLDNGAANYILHHNITYNVDSGIRLNLPSTNNLVYNNTVDGDVNTCPMSDSEFGETKFINNIVTGTYALLFEDIYKDIKVDAQNSLLNCDLSNFEDASNHNYSLKSTSAAIDTAMHLAGITDANEKPDIGALEYGVDAFDYGHNFDSIPELIEQDESCVEYENKVMYGGFECELEITPWVKGGKKISTREWGWSPTFEIETARHSTGRYGLKMGYGYNGNFLGSTDSISQTLMNLESNTTYIFSAWGKVAKSGDTLAMMIKKNGEIVEICYFDSLTWQNKKIEFTTSDSSDAYEIEFSKKVEYDSHAYLDDVTVVKKYDSEVISE